MKISQIYANNIDFKTIVFDKGINFILSVSDGVGKSSLFQLIDFCLLGDKGFLSKEHFKDYIFYIELQIASNRYITIKRPVVGGKNIELKITKQKSMLLDEKEFNKKGSLGVAKSFFENKVNYSLSKFRTYVTYFLRDEENQNDIFVLNKYKQSPEIEYKTIVSNLLGIDGRKIKRQYDLEKELEKLEAQSTEFKNVQKDLEKVIEENKTLVDSHFLDKLKNSIAKYGNMILKKETVLEVGFNNFDTIEFSIQVENNTDHDSTTTKLLCFVFASALAETYVQKRLIKFVAFDSLFHNNNNAYEDRIYKAIDELHRKGIQTIITSKENAIYNPENLLEIKNEYLTGYLSDGDKLMGEF